MNTASMTEYTQSINVHANAAKPQTQRKKDSLLILTNGMAI